jgi:3-deoxy-manno-octulosonate cytidylyltransferase (CMP-KDO synthetase)
MILKYKIIIPARYESSRFPGKPLAMIDGIPMIRRVWKKCIEVLPVEDVLIATDSENIYDFCINNSMEVIMTPYCMTGTDRVYQASLGLDADIFINVQGDEPLIDPNDIKTIIDYSKKNPDFVVNAMCELSSQREFNSISIPKVVVNLKGELMYMSRSPIPITKEKKMVKSYKQVCIYAFPKKHLKSFAGQSKKTPVECIEDIEIIRFLEMGETVKMVEVSQSSIAVDYPEDIRRVENALRTNSK